METTEGVANYFIQHAKTVGCSDFTQLKLQKIVYFSHGWHLATSNQPLFAEPVQAWRYGPVIQSLRDEFRDFGDRPITRAAIKLTFESGQLVEREAALLNPETVTLLFQRIWEIYGGYTPIQITNLTHEKGTPWHQIAEHYNFQIPPGITIPNELIKSYFRNLLFPKAPQRQSIAKLM